MHGSAFFATGPQSTAGRRDGRHWQEIVSDVCRRRRLCCPAGPWPPRRSLAPLLPLPPCRPAGSRCGVPFSSRWTALVAVQSLHDARRVRPATLFQRLAFFSPGCAAKTLFAVPSALRLRRRSAGSGGWPWSCSFSTGGGLRLWPYGSAFDFDRRWWATAVALPQRRP